MLRTYTIPRIIIQRIPVWQEATKTKAIFAQYVHTLIRDVGLVDKLKLQTLEGPQALDPDAMICTGLSKTDPWQQSRDKLFAEYSITNVTPDGWLYCEPKPDNVINCHQVNGTEPLLGGSDPDFVSQDSFKIHAKYGMKVEPFPGEVAYLQHGNIDDYICQSQSDPDDVWIVKKKFFENTYDLISKTDQKV
jgi:hypothetical protein